MKTTNISDKKALAGNSEYESIELSLNSAGLVHIMKALTDLYSDPKTAVLREYVSNAIDSHTKAGISTPIEVTLPSEESPYLVVRDFGVGMSRNEVVHVYASYGNSTKRDNNDEIGGFGFGAKSALAMTDRFDVVSIKDGNRFEFYIEKNDVGAPKMYFVSETVTDEPNGVQVTIPYGRYIFSEATIKDFFMGMPVNSLKINDVLLTDTVYNEDKFDVLSNSDGSVLGWVEKETTITTTNVRVIIGGVEYKLNHNHFYNYDAYNKLYRFSGRVYLNVPIGTADLTPSREELRYTERTLTAIKAACDDFVSAGYTYFQAKFNKLNDVKEVVELKVAFMDRHVWDAEKLTWRGKSIPTAWAVEEGLIVVGNGNERSNNSLSHMANVKQLEYSGYFVKQKGLAVYYDKQTSAYDIRRIGKSIRAAFGYEAVYILDKRDYEETEWFSFLHIEGMKSTTDLVNSTKEWMKANRAPREKNTVKTVTTRVVAHLYHLGQEGDEKVKVERVFAKDARIAKFKTLPKVFYIKEDYSRSLYPNFLFVTDSTETFNSVNARYCDPYGFLSYARKVAGNIPVFLLNSRSSLDKFKSEYPNAVSLEKEVRNSVQATFTPRYDNIDQHEVQREIGYEKMPLVRRLVEHANILKSHVGVKNDAFFTEAKFASEIVSVSKRSRPVEYVNAIHWSGYKETEDSARNKAVVEIAERFSMFVEDYFMLAHCPTVQLDKDTNRRLPQYVTYLNTLGAPIE